jgi:hypothetical protein
MRQIALSILTGCWLVAGLLAGFCFGEESDEVERQFERRVRPLLAARCWECHGPQRQESGLRLDNRDSAMRGGDSGEPAVVPGDLKRSRLYEAVRYEGLKMPPDAPLSADQIADLATWIAAGAPWPTSSSEGNTQSPEAQAELARMTHWAFQPVARPALPPVQQGKWVRTGVDHFVLARLEAEALWPSPEADRRTLLRRLSFDLLGLPPSFELLEAFVRDESPDAYERLVDQLLASPRYGERWGRHWLDVARYADTRGYAFGRERRYPYAYTYRDYVIRAWNEDRPYDQFVREQLAADLIPGSEPTALAALGFLTVGRKFNNRHDDLDDQIDVTSRGFLGLTVSCARCHNHKFDVIPTADYYSLYGVFASSQEPRDLPLIGRPEDHPGYVAFKEELDRRQAALQQHLDERLAEYREKARRSAAEYLFRAYAEWISVKMTAEQAASYSFLTLSPDDRQAKFANAWRTYLQQRLRADDPFWGLLHDFRRLEAARFATLAPDVQRRWLEKPAGTLPGQLHPLLKDALAGITAWQSPLDAAAMYARLVSDTYREFSAGAGQEVHWESVTDPRRSILEVVYGAGTPTEITAGELAGLLNRAERDRQRDLEKQIEAWQASSPGAPPRAMVLAENPQPHQPQIFIRGNPGRPGKSVPRQFLLVLSGANRQPFQKGGGRLELAEQIVAPENPLTRRVITNRIWMHHFGTSLIGTPSDLGQRSERPVHADLLDYLASRLLEHDWSIKALHREIVLSSTYRQQASSGYAETAAGLSLTKTEVDEPVTARSRAAEQTGTNRVEASVPAGETDATTSAGAGSRETNQPLDPRVRQDPENRLYWRMNRRRLEFEAVRDSLLFVTGQLDERMGGRAVDGFVQPGFARRTVYSLIDRQDLPNLLRVFDFASPDQSQAKRPETTVPQQALFLMNSPFVLQQVRALAASLAAISEDPATRVAQVYQRVLGRQPTAAELAAGLDYLLASQAAWQPSPDSLDPWQQYVQVLLLTNEFAFYD